jgi:poly(A) polymerase
VTSVPNADWLHHGELARLIALLDRDGEEARVVGGAVRNALLKLPIDEIDVATTALPQEVIRRAEAAGGKAIPTGIEHGTVTVILDGRSFEVTTLRRDVETFGRKARVEFGRDWRADAERRDFTINALSASADGAVHDYVGGLDDIRARHVRFIGTPQQRIEEDYLRILRFFRFHAAFGEGVPDRAGLEACIRARAGIEGLSRERVRTEMLKLLLTKRAAPTLAVMTESGLLGVIIGGVAFVASVENIVKIEAALGVAADPIRRLGALGVWVVEDAARLAERLRLSNTEAERLSALAGWRSVAPQFGEPAGRASLYRAGPVFFADRAMVAWARSSAGVADESWRALVSLSQRWTAPVFPLKAADLMNRGVVAGPALGVALKAAEEAWIAADFPVDPTAINAIADHAAEGVAAP